MTKLTSSLAKVTSIEWRNSSSRRDYRPRHRLLEYRSRPRTGRGNRRDKTASAGAAVMTLSGRGRQVETQSAYVRERQAALRRRGRQGVTRARNLMCQTKSDSAAGRGNARRLTAVDMRRTALLASRSRPTRACAVNGKFLK